MNRRVFLSMIGMASLSPLIPFGRVWSFPSKIVIPRIDEYADYYSKSQLYPELNAALDDLVWHGAFPFYGDRALENLKNNLVFSSIVI